MVRTFPANTSIDADEEKFSMQVNGPIRYIPSESNLDPEWPAPP